MNLQHLFEMQRKLDQDIIQKKGLQGVDTSEQKILALLVELGECANEWRGFKFWSEDQEPRTNKLEVSFPHAENKEDHGPHHKFVNPLLEEYVDCLHFVLSIGIESFEEVTGFSEYKSMKLRNINDQFNALFDLISGSIGEHKYMEIVAYFLGLGEMLGFTWDQITEAYELKNKVNFERQVNGY